MSTEAQYHADVNDNLPASVKKILAQPRQAPGGRHQEITSLTFQLAGHQKVDPRCSDAFIFELMKERYPEKDDKEIRDLISGAHAKDPEPEARYARPAGGPRVYRPTSKHEGKLEFPRFKLSGAADVPVPKLEMSTIDYLLEDFHPGEIVCLDRNAEFREGKWIPSAKGVFMTMESWVEKLAERPRYFDCEQGAWVRINPMLPDTYSGKDEDVADFRYVLVEFDNRTKLEQWNILLRCDLPISWVIDSGGKSLHAKVRVDAKDAAEHKERTARIYDYLADYIDDKGNKNPSRYSRLPGVMRGDKLQHVVAKNIGAPNWQEWVTTQEEAVKNELLNKLIAGWVTGENFKTIVVPPATAVTGDWLCERDIGFIFGTRGLGKTRFALLLAKAISQAESFGPWISHGGPRKVLYIDGEVSAADMQERNSALSFTGHNMIYLNHEMLFNASDMVVDIADMEHQDALTRLCLMHDIKVIFFDNLSCLAIGIDENDSLAWSEHLLNFVLNLRRRGITPIFIQHAGRNGEMRGHSRREDPLNWIIKLNSVWTADPQIGALFTTEFKKNRNCSEWPSNYEWHFKPDGEKTVATFKEANQVAVFRKLLEDGVSSNAEFAQTMGIEPANVSRLAARGEREGWLKKTGRGYVPVTGGTHTKRPDSPTNNRDKYAGMPPLSHDADSFKSEVLAFIIETEKAHGNVIDHDRARVVFDSIRPVGKNIVVFDQGKQLWHGVNFGQN